MNAEVAALGRRVGPEDRVEVDGKPVAAPETHVYLALNKPLDYVSTASDPQGRPTVLDLVQRPERVYPVGRLDWDTEGLLLLTNDGELTHRLTHPRYGVEKEYHAQVAGRPTDEDLRSLRQGIRLEDGWTAAAQVDELGADRLAVIIHEGRNRQVRRMLDAVGLPAKRLRRVRFGPIQLGDLLSGTARELTEDELAALRRAAGL